MGKRLKICVFGRNIKGLLLWQRKRKETAAASTQLRTVGQNTMGEKMDDDEICDTTHMARLHSFKSILFFFFSLSFSFVVIQLT